MATQLNIKDQKTIALVRDIAARRGASLTATVRALAEEEEARAAAKADALLAELTAINPNPRDLLEPEWRDKSSVEIANSLYNADGSFAE
ncbi:type II toxin-antitoxin system VapB family antitoxin [Sphingomonas sp.]|jgi:hypothetical protein|uniref:type II toxin-antitoxin system VapB family antitoxin n=1 Tax=Sphingomonas sp. TaxID=28214 RepID=UPI0035C79231